MHNASAFYERPFDQAMLEQIGTLRILRLNMAETMLRNLSGTSQQLLERGLADQVDQAELRAELTERINTIRERLAHPERIYTDEIDFYDDLAIDELVASSAAEADDDDELSGDA